MHKAVILIVDDKKENRLAIKLSLKSENYIFKEASNGVEAIEKAKEHEPDIIFMDALMPVMDGFEATKIIKSIEKFKRTPILMITSLDENSNKIKALESGVSDFLSKPFNKQELTARTKSYVELSIVNKNYVSASHNLLTGLPNKSVLLEDLKMLKFSKLVLFRINDYEILEEFYSEDIVSNIVIEYSKNIFNLLGSDCKDTKLYHIHEDEFAILKEISEEEAKDIEKAKKDCEQFYVNTKEYIIKVDGYEYSIEIILSFCFGENNAYEHARVGLNHGIKNKDKIVFANDIVDFVRDEAIKNQNTIKMVRKALDNNKIVSHFQPLYNNKEQKIEKYESLVRLIDESNKVVSPFSFIEAAKTGKYHTQITEHVINNSINMLNKIEGDISINLSAVDIEDKYIRNLLLSYFSFDKETASRIVLELLEDESFENFELTKSFIHDIKRYGVKIAIDDFGSGYSNFERLLDFEPDIIKIDGSLIKNIHEDKFSRSIVETIQLFASKIGVKTVAEFVSCKEIFDIVNEIGIDYSQGYYIGKPLSAQELLG